MRWRIDRNHRIVLGEFAALVIGVFLGVQVDRWYEDRKEAHDDRNYLQRLADDVADMTRVYDDLAPRPEASMGEAQTARRALQACDASPQNQQALRQTLSDHQFLPSFPGWRATYDDMVASGAFARVRNAALKAAAAKLFAGLEWAQDNVNYQRQDLGRASNLLIGRLEFTNSDDGQLQTACFDFETLCGNRPVRSALAEVVDSRSDWGFMAERVREKLGQLTAMLEQELVTS